MPKKKKGKKKEKKEAAPPPPPPPPRVPVWPHGAVPDWQRVEGDVGAAVPEWQQLPAVVSTPPPDAKLCYDRFRISPTNQGPRLVDSLSTTTSELSGRKELRSVVESAYNAIAALSTASIKERLARQGKMSQVSAPELRARLGALAAASALVRIARAEGVGEDQIREARVGDTDGDGVDTETLEALTTLIVTERANRQVAAANAAKAATEETVAAAGNASFLLTSVTPSPSSSSASATPKAVRTLKPIRRRPSPSRYAFHDSLDVSHAPSKGSWSTPKRLEDGFKYIKEGGHQRKSPGDSLLETGSLSSSFSYQRATTAHGISRSASCPPIVARGTMSGHGNVAGASWLAADDLLNSTAALEVFTVDERNRRQAFEARAESPEFVRTYQIKQLQRNGYSRGTHAETGKTMWFKKSADGRVKICDPGSDLLLPTLPDHADAAVFSPPTSPVRVQGGSTNPAPQAALRRVGRTKCGLTAGNSDWLVGQSTSNKSFSFTHKLKEGEERIYRPVR